MKDNNAEKNMEAYFGDAVIKSPEGGIRFGVFEALERRAIKHGFSFVPDNMSFGAEKEEVGRKELSSRLEKLFHQLSIPVEKQVIMTANLFRPNGNFIHIGEQGVVLDQLPLLREIYGDTPTSSLTQEYPRFIGSEYVADGIFTYEPGLVLEVISRDCIPMIVASRSAQAGFTGIVHAGRRQIEAGLGERVVKYCRDLFRAEPGELLIGMGPHICKDHYVFDRREIREDERGENILVAEERWGDYLTNKSKDIFSLDIGGLLMQELIDHGIPHENIAQANICTYETQEQGLSSASLRYQNEHHLPPSRMVTLAMHTRVDEK